MSPERRLYERLEIELPCRLSITGAPATGRRAAPAELRFEAYARSANLSLGGVFLKTGFLLKEGLELTVDLGLPDGPLAIAGRIARAVPEEETGGPTGLGIEFLEMDAKSREALLRFFTPPRYRAFLAQLAQDFPHLPKELPPDRVSLLLNLWEAFKVNGPPPDEHPLPTSVAPARGPKGGGGRGRR